VGSNSREAQRRREI